jgi:cytochrome b subunit of formate dehydrogenase
MAAGTVVFLAAPTHQGAAQDTTREGGQRDAPVAPSSSTCLACHGTQSLAVQDSAGASRSLYVDPRVFQGSIHGAFDCQVCHGAITVFPHPDSVPPVDCGSCHTDVTAAYRSHGGLSESPISGRDFPACWDCHGTHDILPASDPHSQVALANLPATCGSCHGDPEIVGQYHIPTIEPVEAFSLSVHAQLPQGKDHPAASCIDCHSATGTGHQILPPIDPQSTVNHFNIPRTCGGCHQEIGQDFGRSSHGLAAARGEADAPVCTTCHGEHAIRPISDPASPVYPTNVSLTICGPCHASRLMNQKYGLPTGIMASWQHSYHGLKSTDGDAQVANCSSCHSAHLTLPPSDAASSVAPANLERTCGRCHQGISAAVVRVPIHATTGIALNRTGEIFRSIYIVAIVVIIGLMVIHWLIDLYRKITLLNREKQVVRMLRDELWQHTLLMVSFTVLAITGFAFQYAGSWWARAMFGFEGGFTLRRIIHRVAAAVFMGTAVWHLVYLSRKRGRAFLRDMFPSLKDFRQFGQMIMFNLGRRRDGPRFGRFSYVEKAEYWALVWGTVVMTLTGLALWFGNVTEHLLQVQALGVMLVVHYYEAILASLAIVVWHFYSTIFNPTVYPNNPSWYMGTMPLQMYRDEHPADPAVAGRLKGEAEEEESQCS